MIKFNELIDMLEEDFYDLDREDLMIVARKLSEALMLIEDAICDLEEGYEELNEASGDKKKSIPKLIWRICNKGQGNAVPVGFDPRTFDSIKRYAGTSKGGGIAVAAPDGMKKWFKDKRNDSQMDDHRKNKKEQDAKDSAKFTPTTKKTLKADKDARVKRDKRRLAKAFGVKEKDVHND